LFPTTQEPTVSPTVSPTITQYEKYDYGIEDCVSSGATGIQCPRADLELVCDKYDSEIGGFRECLNACKPSFCCIHDAIANPLAIPCDDPNCCLFTPCYIIWWKLHDTPWPALYLNFVQSDDFYDMDAAEAGGIVNEDEFFRALILHHFDNFADIWNESENWDASEYFAVSENWLCPTCEQVPSPLALDRTVSVGAVARRRSLHENAPASDIDIGDDSDLIMQELRERNKRERHLMNNA